MGAPLSRRGAAAGVALLAVLALALRAHGIGFGLPHATFSDARVLVDQAAALRAGEPDPDDHRLYPHLVPRVVSWLPDAEARAAPDDALDTHLARAAQPFEQARWVSVWLSLLILPATYKLARTSLPRGPALFAVALLATSLLHVSFAQQERPHGALAAFTAIAVAVAVHLRRRPTIGAYLLAGAAGALALGSLHSGVAALIPIAAAHLLRERAAGRGPAWGLLPPAIAVAAVPLFYPFQFEPTRELAVETKGEASVLNLSGHFVKLEQFDGGGFATVFGSLLSYDPLLLGLAAVGAGAWLVRRRRPSRDQLVLVAYAVPYLLVLGLYGKTAERFVLPLLPFLAVLAAAPLAHRPRALVPAALLLLVPLTCAWRLGAVRAAPDTYTEVAGWLADEVDPERRVLLVLDPNQDLPLGQDEGALAAGEGWPWPSRWHEYQRRQARPVDGARDLRVPSGVPFRELSAEPLDALRRCGAQLVVVERVGGGPRSAPQRAIRDALQRSSRRVHVVAPGTDEEGARLFVRQVSWRRPLFPRLFDVERTGPTLEVYDLYTSE